MKRAVRILNGIICLSIMTMGVAVAETTFTPLNFDDATTVKTKTVSPVPTVRTTGTEGRNTLLEPSLVTGGSKMQNAILQLDNAQTDVRNQLLDYRTNYSEIDSRYQAAKAERKAAQKQIKQSEKKIKNLEKAKTKIRKNFEQKINQY